MKVRLNKNAFVRVWESHCYIENQVNHIAKTYIGREASVIVALSRELQDVADISAVSGIPISNVIDFLKSLEELWMVIIECDNKHSDFQEHDFKYSQLEEIDNLFKNISGDLFEPSQPWLRSLTIEITSLCNERCVHCYLPDQKRHKGGKMSLDKIRSIIDEYVSMNGLRIVFSGGEVLIHPDVFELMEYCREKDLMVILQSNALLLDDDKIRRLKELRIFNLQVSLYSTDETIHDSITGIKGSWKKTNRNIQKIVENDIPLMISCPIMRPNYHGYRSMVEYCNSLNVFCYVDYILMAQSDLCTENLSIRLNESEMSELIDEMLEVRPTYIEKLRSLKKDTDLENVNFAQRFKSCSVLKNSLGIQVNGVAYPCPGWQDMSLGNIYENTLHHIWYESPQTIRLRGIRPSDIPHCAGCDKQNYCDMCMVYNYNENNGDIYDVCESFCKSAAMLKAKVRARFNETRIK